MFKVLVVAAHHAPVHLLKFITHQREKQCLLFDVDHAERQFIDKCREVRTYIQHR